jgi:hypothetical protein
MRIRDIGTSELVEMNGHDVPVRRVEEHLSVKAKAASGNAPSTMSSPVKRVARAGMQAPQFIYEGTHSISPDIFPKRNDEIQFGGFRFINFQLPLPPRALARN